MVAHAQWAFQVSQGSVETLLRWGGKRLHRFEANLFWKRCTKFHQNRLSFVEDITKKTFWSLFFLDTVYYDAYWLRDMLKWASTNICLIIHNALKSTVTVWHITQVNFLIHQNAVIHQNLSTNYFILHTFITLSKVFKTLLNVINSHW